MSKNRTMEEIKDALWNYCLRNNIPQEDCNYFRDLLEEAYSTGDSDGWSQALRERTSARIETAERLQRERD
jgi:hypothetical protein